MLSIDFNKRKLYVLPVYQPTEELIEAIANILLPRKAVKRLDLKMTPGGEFFDAFSNLKNKLLQSHILSICKV